MSRTVFHISDHAAYQNYTSLRVTSTVFANEIANFRYFTRSYGVCQPIFRKLWLLAMGFSRAICLWKNQIRERIKILQFREKKVQVQPQNLVTSIALHASLKCFPPYVCLQVTHTFCRKDSWIFCNFTGETCIYISSSVMWRTTPGCMRACKRTSRNTINHGHSVSQVTTIIVVRDLQCMGILLVAHSDEGLLACRQGHVLCVCSILYKIGEFKRLLVAS